MSTLHLCRMTDDEARYYLEQLRWPDGAVCSHCGSSNVVELRGESTKPGTRKCRDCHRKFTVTVGTIFERSHVPLSNWMYAYARMCSSKKGFAAKQLQRELGISYETAWFMCHRIRHSMGTATFQLTGTIEIDETYVGGKPKKSDGVERKRGRGTKKVPVVALVQRGGGVRTKVVCDVTSNTIREIIDTHVESESRIITDEFAAYNFVSKETDHEHRKVNHSKGEYATADGVHTNTVEGFFSLLKRGVYGTYHRLSKEHLQRYCDEFAFRYNHRQFSDLDIARSAIQGASGKRLMYASVITPKRSDESAV